MLVLGIKILFKEGKFIDFKSVSLDLDKILDKRNWVRLLSLRRFPHRTLTYIPSVGCDNYSKERFSVIDKAKCVALILFLEIRALLR